MTIFERIRNKAQQAFTGIGNAIDRDQSMAGVQLAQGGLGNRIQKYFEPTPQVRPRDIVRELPGATTQVVSDYVVQPVTRGITTAVNSLERLIGAGDGVTTPEELSAATPNPELSSFLFGDKPITSLQEITERRSPQTAGWLQGAGVNPDVAQNIAPPITFLGAAGLTALDAVPSDPTDIVQAGRRAIAGAAPDALKMVDDVVPLADDVARAIENTTVPLIKSGQPKVLPIADILSPEIKNTVPLIRSNPPTVMNTAEMAGKSDAGIPLVKANSNKILNLAEEATTPAPSVALKNADEPRVLHLNPPGFQQIPYANDTVPLTRANTKTLEVIKNKSESPSGVTVTEMLNGKTKYSYKGDGTEVISKADDTKNAAPVIDDLRETPKPGVQGVPKSGLARAWDDLARSSRGVIGRSGAAGKRIQETLDIADEEGALTAGAQVDDMYQVLRSLSKQEKATLADVIEGTAKPISEAQAKAAAVWRNISTDIYTRARDAGLDIGQIENYFPHHAIRGDKRSIGGMMSKNAPRRYGNLELARQTDMPYDKDPSVLMDYIESANKRIAEAKHFGASDEVLYNLANQVAKDGGDSEQVTKYLNQILGKEQDQLGKELSETIRSTQTVLKLNPATAVTNLTQNLSTLLRTDVGSTAKAIQKAITNPTEAFSNARRAGEISADEARVLSDYAGQGKVVTKWLRAIGMLGAEKINRVIAVNAGMEYTTKLARQSKNGDQAALRELKRLGMTTNDFDALKGGRNISQQTQFATSPGELPYSWHTPLGKVMTQFKSFAYKQTQYLNKEFNPIAGRVVQEARSGNFKPLANAMITYGVAAPIVGEVVADIKALLANKERETEFGTPERYVENILAATSLGLLDSTGGLFGEYGKAGVVSTIGGVTAGDAYKGIDAVASLISDNEYDKRKAARFALNQIPFGVGKAISNTVVPNSYVDNMFGGVNEGLGDKDKQTYLNLKTSDPNQAEIFKQTQQDARDSEKGNFITNLFGGGEKKVTATIPGKDATPEEKKAFNSQVQDMLDAGGVPDAAMLKHYVTKGNDASSKLIEERTKAYEGLRSAMNNEYYTEEQKDSILKASGVDPKNYDYYELASKDQDVRLQELLPKLDNMADADMVEFLMKGRKAIAGKQLVSNAMVDYLYENDYIGEHEKDAIKALKYDEIQDKFYFNKSFAKKGKGSSLTYKQAKALFNVELPKFDKIKSLDALLENYSTRSSQTARPDDTLIDSILESKPKNRTAKQEGLWF